LKNANHALYGCLIHITQAHYMADPPKTVAGLDGAATQSAVAIATLLH
jgi:hypothetical protein